MLKSNLEKAINGAFSLSGIIEGGQSIRKGDQPPDVFVHLGWIVEILADNLAGITVAGVKTLHMDGSPAWYKGLLLVPPIWEPLDREFGGQNLKPVDMEWPNSIITAFESMNTVPYNYIAAARLGAGNHRYRVHAYAHPLNTTHINFYGFPVHKNQQAFWEAIEETISSLGEAMGDPEIQEFLDQCDNMILE
ncbi:MAG: hypothetical protein HY862_20415 [Chloroflexi bacterium]|nr:hypothetical protein [Chloroflexota bacterium]